MTDLRTAAQQALEALKVATTPLAKDRQEVLRAVAALKAALTQEPQTTHSAECWRWHHKCAVAKIERECKHD